VQAGQKGKNRKGETKESSSSTSINDVLHVMMGCIKSSYLQYIWERSKGAKDAKMTSHRSFNVARLASRLQVLL
jgi:hypothetical protein